MQQQHHAVRIPITLVKGFGRGAEYIATLGDLTGHGSTQATAKADLAAQIVQSAQPVDDEPAFARDDDGALIVAIPDGRGDVHVWRLAEQTTGASARHITTCGGPADQAIAGCGHYTPIRRHQ